MVIDSAAGGGGGGGKGHTRANDVNTSARRMSANVTTKKGARTMRPEPLHGGPRQRTGTDEQDESALPRRPVLTLSRGRARPHLRNAVRSSPASTFAGKNKTATKAL